METALSSCEKCDNDICQDRKLSDPEYTDKVVLLSGNLLELHVFPHCLNV